MTVVLQSPNATTQAAKKPEPVAQATPALNLDDLKAVESSIKQADKEKEEQLKLHQNAVEKTLKAAIEK